MTEIDDASQVLPESVMARITRVSTLLTVWEMIHSNVVAGVESFFSGGIGDYDYSDYRREVLSQAVGGTTLFDASAAWLVGKGAITSEDVAMMERIRWHRNEVGLDIDSYIGDPPYVVDLALLGPSRDMMRRLGNFWTQIEGALENGSPIDVERDEYNALYLPLFDYLLSLTSVTSETIHLDSNELNGV
jgi:hypothetical protein